MNAASASAIRALVKLAITAKRDRERFVPCTANWYVYNSEFQSYKNAYRVVAHCAKLEVLK